MNWHYKLKHTFQIYLIDIRYITRYDELDVIWFIISVVSAQQILWNYEELTERIYEKKGDLKWEGAIWDGKYYTDLPDRIRKVFPIYGTQDIKTNEANVLEIRNEPVVAFMVTRDSWFPMSQNGWATVGIGAYLGPNFNDIIIYEKLLKPGTYDIPPSTSL